MEIPEKFFKLLEFIKGELYFSSDHIVSMSQKEYEDLGLTKIDVQQVFATMEEKGIIHGYKVWYSLKEDGKPITHEDKKFILDCKDSNEQLLGLITQDDAIRYQLVISVCEKFDEFYRKNKEQEISPVITKKQISFDKEKSILYINGEKILISRKNDKTNAHYILEYIFKNSECRSAKNYYSEMFDILGDNQENYLWKKYYRACEDIREKIRKETKNHIDDFLIYTTGKTGFVQINPDYLKK